MICARPVLIDTIAASLIQTLQVSPMEAHPERINLPNLTDLVGTYFGENEDKGALHLMRNGLVASALLYEIADMFLRRTFYIKYSFSLDGHRRTGLVRSLVQEALALARKFQMAHASACIQDQNVASRQLALSLGFRQFECNFVKSALLRHAETTSYPEHRLSYDSNLVGAAYLHDAIFEGVKPYCGTDDEDVYDLKMVQSFLAPYLSSREGYYVAMRCSPDRKAQPFVLCRRVETAFKDYLNVDYIHAPEPFVPILMGLIEMFALDKGLREVGISVHHRDHILISALLRCGYILCDRTYVQKIK